jgi:phosphoenolpyruvate-protein phosphotransferase (PTS system enzyme I)
MMRVQGTGASEGIAMGAARLLATRLIVVDRWIAAEEVEREVERLDAAIEATDESFAVVLGQWEAESRHDGFAILEAHRMILNSTELVGGAAALVREERLAAESAVQRVVQRIVASFDELEDPYFKERGGDIESVGERLLHTLTGSAATRPAAKGSGGEIGVGSMLSAIDAHHIQAAGFSGVVTERGGKTSHLAIILRALEIPYVVAGPGLMRAIRRGTTLIIDGQCGEIIVDPDEETRRSFIDRRARELARAARLQSGLGRPAATRDGTRIHVGANIESLAEIPRAVALGAESIGLLRTEFLYLYRSDLPTEEEQYQDAVASLAALGGRVATFRTLDLGGDKLPVSVRIPDGANPSLGVRAIRVSARLPAMFRTQLRALYRASTAGPVRIMFPMVSGIAELHQALEVCTEVRAELSREGIPFDARVPLGVMVETPSAAVTVDHLAEVCDFFSVGTNDLIQYAFAADRDNGDVAYLYHPLHPAMLRLIKYAVDAAVAAGKPISVCGDMAGDPTYTWVLLGLGVRELSMAPRLIPAVRSVIAATDLAEAQAMTAQALSLRSDTQVEELVVGGMQRRFPLELPPAP